jgi:hypothetical protein
MGTLSLYRMDLRKKAILVNSCQGKNRGAASCFGLLMSGCGYGVIHNRVKHIH